MVKLLHFEFRKICKQRKSLFVLGLFLVLIVSFFSVESIMESSNLKKYEDITSRNLEYLQNVPDSIPNNEKIFLEKLSIVQEKKLEALQENNKRDVFLLELEETTLELEGREKGVSQSLVSYTELEQQVELNNRIKENGLLPRDLKFDGPGFLINVMESLLPLHFFLLLLLLIGDITGYENDQGTMRLLKSTPYSKIQLIFSKFIVSVCVGIGFLSVLFLLSYGLGGIFKGFEGFQYPEYVNGEWSTTGKLLAEYFLYSALLVIFISALIQFMHLFIRRGLITLLTLFILFAIQFFVSPHLLASNSTISWNPIIYLNPGPIIRNEAYIYSEALLKLGLFTVFLLILSIGIVRLNRKLYPGL